MIALYIPRQSPIHKLRASFKLIVLAALALTLSFINHPAILSGALFLVITGFAVAKLPARALFRAYRPAFFVMALFVALQLAFATPYAALTLFLRLSAVLLAASLLTYTTRFSDMIDCLTAMVRPFSSWGVPAAHVGLALALAIRFIPVLMSKYEEVQAARLSRGARSWSVFALGPVLLSALRMTNEISDAVVARRYEERDERASYDR